MSEDRLLYEVRDGVATLILNDPARMNPLAPATLRGALDALRRVQDDMAVRVFVLRGCGRAFCAGADLAAVGSDPVAAAEVGGRIHDQGNRLVAALHALPVPTLAVVNGIAAGGGVALALACDVCVAARSAYFYSPFTVALGLVPDLGTAWFAQRAVGRARSMGASLLGDKVSAEQAVHWGMIWACVEDAALDEEAHRIAARLAALSPQAAAATRALHDVAESSTLDEQLAWERRRQPELIGNGAFAEGVRAFLAKRRPVFRGR